MRSRNENQQQNKPSNSNIIQLNCKKMQQKMVIRLNFSLNVIFYKRQGVVYAKKNRNQHP